MRLGSLRKSVLPLLVCLAVAGCWKSSEERAAEHYDNGLKLVAEGDFDRALVEFRNTLKLSKNNTDARRQMAQIFKERGNFQAAYRNYLSVVEKNPEDLEGRMALSELSFAIRDWEEFDRHSAVAVSLAPNDPAVQAINTGVQYRNAVLAEDSALRDSLLAQAETLSPDQPDNEILRQILIDGYVSQEKFDKALSELEKSIENDPDELKLYSAKLELFARQNRPDAMEEEMRRMVVQFPEDANVKSTLLRFLISRDKPDEAEAFLRNTMASAPDDKTRIGTYTSLIQFLLATQGTEAALAELETGLAKEPGQDTLRTLRASINFDTGKRSEGITELQDILSAESSTLSKTEQQNIKVALAKMLVTDGNEVGGRKLVEEILAEDPNSVGALKMQAVWLTREDNTDGAINALRTALDAAPQDAEAMTLMAEAYKRAGNTELMLNFLSLAVEASNSAPLQALRYAAALNQADKPLQAESVLINALRITPGNVDVLTALGQIYLAIDDVPRARQAVDTLRKIETDNAQSNANALNIELLARESGVEEALGYLEGLSQESGATGAQAKLALLRARLENGEGDAALEYAKSLVAEDPENLQLRNALALTYASVRDYTAAETEFKAVLDANPTVVPVWLQLARVYIAKGDQPAAIAAIDDGLEAVPGAPDLLWGKASFMQNAGDVGGAIDIYEELYKRFSGSPVIANNLASLLSTYRADDPDSIARAQVIARRLKDSDLPAFQDTYGWLQHLDGDHEAARSYLEPAAEGLPDDVSVQVHLGMVYAALDRKEDALRQLQKAITTAGPLGTEALVEAARAKIAELEAQ
ncbi:tetratricopeptide repeat protein [Litoreibacter meonggei]|uniref:Tetratricopeptide repeat protein n=1 Tax=Litoreibacter meonggei TaxID=1049199 RepID=A0A497VDE3_9RHOB|nr:tetratricopeptide repeat protein [Litoreibacter meonggei]RLJ36189.1 tetratricopeptide repeat protein [Litoreibacter meonggei]